MIIGHVRTVTSMLMTDVGQGNLANTHEYFANQNKIWRTEMRLGKLYFELREQQNFYQWDQMVNFSNFCQNNIFTVIYS